jgi:DNA-directed RNA polymerase specialized sigma24 family protein
MRQQPIPSDDDRLMSDEFLEYKDPEWRDRAHFFAIPGRAIRWRLINMGCRKPLTYVPVEELEALPVNLELAIDIDRLLDELAATHPGWCTVVQMKCFLGLTDQEAAKVLGIRRHTLQHMWRHARWWLRERMEGNATTGKSIGR